MRGASNYTIDAKGRVTIPSRFREILGDNFVVTRGFGHCLAAYPMERWERIERKLSAQSLTNEIAQKINRIFLGNAADVEVDKMGRILLPQTLREQAGISRDVVITGLGDRVEIWDLDQWNHENGPEALDHLTQEQLSGLAGMEL